MIHIVGVGVEGPSSLSAASMETLRSAKLIIGSERLLSQLPELPAKKQSLMSDLFKLVDILKKKRKSDVVVLASGDPNLFGITAYLLKHFGKEDISVTPAVSSMQWAFALVKETWEDAEIVSAHGRGLDEVIRATLARNKVGVFTDDKNSPDKVAAALLAHGVSDRRVFVCENIGLEKLKVSEGTIEEIAREKYSPINVMIIKKERLAEQEQKIPSKALGVPDFHFAHREGMITKAEVRAITLSKLRPDKGKVMWDVGAGCGSVSIEAEGLISPGKVYAVEKDPTQFAYLKKNIAKFAASNVEPIEGEAPAALKVLPDPDMVFIGGSSGKLRDIFEYVDERLRPGGRIVANIVTLENLAEVTQFMKDFRYAFEVTTANIARTKELANMRFMVAANPVHIIFGVKT